jgi:hypothetical protein
MLTIVGLNLINIVIMIWSAAQTFEIQYCSEEARQCNSDNYLQTSQIIIYPLKVLDIITILAMVGSVITFMVSNLMDPGYVAQQCNFMEIL